MVGSSDTRREDSRMTIDEIKHDDYTTAREIPLWEAAIAAGTLGPFVTAFCTELGKRLGGAAADRVSQVHLRRKRRDPTKADLFVEFDDSVTVLELEEGLPDEAKLALLDLDMNAESIRGQRLRWNVEEQAWLPTDT